MIAFLSRFLRITVRVSNEVIYISMNVNLRVLDDNLMALL